MITFENRTLTVRLGQRRAAAASTNVVIQDLLDAIVVDETPASGVNLDGDRSVSGRLTLSFVTNAAPTPTPTPTTADVRVVWSADRVTTASELATGSGFTSNSFNVPAHTGFGYLVIWRADDAGGAPTGITFDGQPQRAAFDDNGTALAAAGGVDGEYVVSLVELDGDNIGGDAMVLS